MNKLSVTRIANWISLLLILAMIAVTFLPCWTYQTKEKVEIDGKKQNVTVTKEVSISEYTWFLKDHKDLTKEFEDLYEDEEDFFVNDMITAPALLMVLGVALGILSLWYQALPAGTALALLLSIVTAIGYNVSPEYGLGSCMQTVTLVSYVALGISAVGMALSVLEILNKKAAKKAAKLAAENA